MASLGTMPRPSALFRQSLLPVGLLLACLPTLFPQAASPVAPPAGATRLIPASDPRFRYEGRFDDTNPTGPVVVWQGSRIRIDFTGNQLVLRFDGLDGQNFFDMQVDDRAVVLAVPPGADQRLVFPQSLGGGNHRLMLFKRSEASAGTVRFRGLRPGARSRRPRHRATGWRWSSSATPSPSAPATRMAPPTSGRTAARTTTP
jgi:hypothetical protein